jgi:molybdopterin/thiamine biosynthesis adenylyltransferase
MAYTVDRWPDAIHLIGVGGIGTHVLLALIELGAKEVHVWDDDIVSAHNRPNQFVYAKGDIGEPKVYGVQQFVERQGYDVTIVPHAERVAGNTVLEGIVISGVDTMSSRKVIWESVSRSASFIPVYIDGRIGDEYVYVLTIDPCDPLQTERYQKTLLGDNDVRDLSCTTRENPHAALTVAATVSTHLTLRLAGEPVKDAVYRNLKREATPIVQHKPGVTEQE